MIDPRVQDTDFVAGVREAERALRSLFEPTPLQRNDFLSSRYGGDVWLKREDLSPVRSYKIRGAINAMRKVLARPGQGPARFVCASAGNHAQGMAFACRHFGVEGVVFMPVTTPAAEDRQDPPVRRRPRRDPPRRRLFRRHPRRGAELRRRGRRHLSAALRRRRRHRGPGDLRPRDRRAVPRHPDTVVIPVGGGGLSSGIVGLLAALAPATAIRFVEPVGGPSLRRSLEARQQVTLAQVDNFVDGAAVARIGDRNWDVLKRFAPADVTLSPEGRICATMVEMLNVEGIVLEPAGALAIDALHDLGPLDGRSVVAIVSGSNFDFERLPDVKERALRWEGRKKYYILRLPQRPGALREFLSVLGPDDDISRFEYLKKSARNFGSVLLGIETSARDNFTALEARMRAAGFTWLDITEDAVITSLII